MPENSPDWAKEVLQPDFLQRLDTMALHRFTQPGLAEEAATYALNHLSDGQWAACQSYRGKAQPRTFLLTLASHALEEFSRQRFGRLRPPEWLKREGALWVRVWQQLCLERQLPQTVIDAACAQAGRTHEFVAGIIRILKARLPWCGDSAREIPDHCDDCQFYDSPTPDITQQLQGDQLENTLNELYALLFSEPCPSNSSMKPQPWQRVRDELNLNAEDIMLLKLAHQEGLKLNAIAKLLGMPSYQPGRLLKALHQRIAQAMANQGLAEGLQEALAEADMSENYRPQQP